MYFTMYRGEDRLVLRGEVRRGVCPDVGDLVPVLISGEDMVQNVLRLRGVITRS